MKTLTILFAFFLFTAAACQDKYPELEDGLYTEIITNKGSFVAKFYHEETPLTVANFISLAEGTNSLVDSTYAGKNFYEGLIFHRVMKDFMIQGGCPFGTGMGDPGYKFPDEFVEDLKHSGKGVLSMANGGPNSNGSQFFVTLKDTPWLDQRHTVFGQIVLGQDVVDAIGLLPVGARNKPVDSIVIQDVNIINKGGIKVPSFEEAMADIEAKKKEKEAEIAKVAAATVGDLNKLKEQAEELPSGLKIYWNQRGKGMKPQEGNRVRMNYAGYFGDGRLFDSNIREIEEKYDMLNATKVAQGGYTPAPTSYSKDAQLVAGFREGLLQMSLGDKVTLFVPSHLGYGAQGRVLSLNWN